MSGVDPAYRTFVSYIDKSREFYAAHGYEAPYRWARYTDAPFTGLQRPIEASRLGLITTATLLREGSDGADESRPPKSVYAAPTDPPPERLFTQDLAWDKEATHTEDLCSFFPLRQLGELEAEGAIGSVSPRFYGVPTDYSQRRTEEHDAPEVLRLLREDGVDAALLVPL